ncbi:DUF2232 domain-containing protein [bacterium]|nr:DUF2232 domain-containing protein [bacterium]
MADLNAHSPYSAHHPRPEAKRSKPRRLAPWLMYLIVPPAAVLLILKTAAGDLNTALITSALSLFVFWAGFSLANPRLIGLELIGVIVGTYYWVQPPMAVLWVTASAIAAGGGVFLFHREKDEQDYFFLVPAAAFAGFVFLIWLGAGASLKPALLRAQRELSVSRRETLALARQLEDQKIEMGRLMREGIEWAGPRYGVLVTTSWLTMWILVLWVAGRVSRRVLGQFQKRRHAFVLFKIRDRYIFLLIIGLILEIFNGLVPSGGMQWLAIPLLAIFALACFIEGLAIVLFFGALQRFRGQRWAGRIWNLAGVVLLFSIWQAAVLIGLTDIWFDFRRLQGLRRIDEKA